MKSVQLITDGSCLGNPGPGGWAYILRYGAHKRECAGGAPHTTNNRMELTAAIEGLRALKEPCQVTIVTDPSTQERAPRGQGLKQAAADEGEKTGAQPGAGEALDAPYRHTAVWEWTGPTPA
jgi:ribonuclease HI